MDRAKTKQNKIILGEVTQTPKDKYGVHLLIYECWLLSLQ